MRAEFDDIKSRKITKVIQQKCDSFQEKLASLKFLDPACGSGNFLTETYICLRRLENEVIKFKYKGMSLLGLEELNPVKISISQFYGIEINDFAVAVATTALWIAESQMLHETESIIQRDIDFLPLKSNSNIHVGNALRMDWEQIIPKSELNYIMGNPPFVGARMQSEVQKQDLLSVCKDSNGKEISRAGFLDYVSGWYFKTARIIQNTEIECAFVSTNSITQGEQVALLWENLEKKYNIKINYAYRTFNWNNEAISSAHVHCVIIGFSCLNKTIKIIFDEQSKQKREFVSQINGFLYDAPSCYIMRLNRPLCDVPKITNGNRAYDGNNLVLTPNEAEELIEKNPLSIKYILSYYMGADLLKGKPRKVLWLKGVSPKELKEMPLVLARINAVKKMRLASKNPSTKKAAETPHLFQMICQPTETYLAFPRVSSQRRNYIPMTFLSKDCICGDKLIIIPQANLYHFGVLMSVVHNAWMRVVSGRLKSDYEYSSSVYNNFIWAEATQQQIEQIVKTAQAILDARDLYPDSSLADLYDPLTMPLELLKAHKANDKAVLALYGFKPDVTEDEIVAKLMLMYAEKVKQFGQTIA